MASDEQTKTVTPGIIQMAANLASTAKDVAVTAVTTGVVMATKELATSRLGICNECEVYNKEASRCGKCGCFMQMKVTFEASKCPLNKW